VYGCVMKVTANPRHITTAAAAAAEAVLQQIDDGAINELELDVTSFRTARRQWHVTRAAFSAVRPCHRLPRGSLYQSRRRRPAGRL